MQARYYPWAVLGGLAVTLAPGTPAWLIPLAGAALHMTYDVDPEGWQNTGQRLLELMDTTQQQYLPAARRLLTRQADDQADDQAVAPLARPAAAASSTRPTAIAAPAAAASSTRPTAIAERDPLLTTLENEPHRLIIGRSRGGKTTLIHEMATSWAEQGAKVVVLDPDASPGVWPGCTVVGGGDNFPAIKQAIDITAGEIKRRRDLFSAGVRQFQPLHIVIDEAGYILPDVEGAMEVVEDIGRRGAKLGIQLTLGVQDKQVKTLGLEGKSKILDNFIIADVMKRHDGQRVALIKDPVDGTKTNFIIPQLRDPESLVVQRPAAAAPKPAAKPAPKPVENPDSLLGALLGEAVPIDTAASTDTKAAQSLGTASDTSTEQNDGIGTTVVRTGEGVITIHNTLIAPEPRRKRPGGPKVSLGKMVQKRELYHQVKALVEQGLSATKIRQELKLNQAVSQALVRRAKAELGKS